MFSGQLDLTNIRPNTPGPRRVGTAPKERPVTEISDFTMDYFSLKGKNAIVTGGNTGLGQAFALALATAGANIFVPSIVDDDGTTGPLVEDRGGRYEFLKADVTAAGRAGRDRRRLRRPARLSRHPREQRRHLPAGRRARLRPRAVGRHRRREPHGRLRDGLRGGQGHDPAALPARSSTSARCSRSSAAAGRRRTRPPSTAWPGSPRLTVTSSPSTTSRSTASLPATTPRRSPRPHAATR